jgi:hypothetical protein
MAAGVATFRLGCPVQEVAGALRWVVCCTSCMLFVGSAHAQDACSAVNICFAPIHLSQASRMPPLTQKCLLHSSAPLPRLKLQREAGGVAVLLRL